MNMADMFSRHDILDKLDDVCRAKCPHDSWLRWEHCEDCLLGSAINAVEDWPKVNYGTEKTEQ